MKTRKIRSLGVMLLPLILCTCIEPYNPELSEYQSLMVVDALITDEDASNYVKLEKSIATANATPKKIKDAFVTITDNTGYTVTLTEISDGLYKTDSLTFRGVAGRSYTLYIKTAEGAEYQSETTLMPESRDIDTVYFSRDSEPAANSSEMNPGIRIYLDAQNPSDQRYFRWTYDEYWEFHTMFPKQFNYIDKNNIVQIPITKNICWKHSKSDEILISSSSGNGDNNYSNKPVLFINPMKSDRLRVQYCVDIKQLSISKKEYDFWYNLQQINESGGDIFDKPPYPVISNIHNINDPDEPVLGYFQVAGVSHYRRYITRKDVNSLELALYDYECDMVILGPGDPQPELVELPVTFNSIYKHYVEKNYIFILPYYTISGELERLVFVSAPCSDCTLTGNLNKPEFWVDLQEEE